MARSPWCLHPSCFHFLWVGVAQVGMTSPLFSSLTQGSSGAFSPLKKKKLRTENDFVKFDTPLLPKPLFFRKAKSSTATPGAPAMQVSALRPNQRGCGWPLLLSTGHGLLFQDPRSAVRAVPGLLGPTLGIDQRCLL